jgi:predicted negative regulator of RcsB-dependent stress response
MATLDLEEQESLDQLKAFWARFGNSITWVLLVALACWAAWTGWHWYQRDQSFKASAMYDELDTAAQAGDADRAAAIFARMKDGYARTTYAEQGGLLLAKVQYDKSKPEDAKATLGWVAEHASESEYQTLAHLRLASVLLDQKKYDEALKQLDDAKAASFAALVADRRGDVLAAQGKSDEAKAAYMQAWKAIGPTLAYRRLVEAKLNALGAVPEAATK